MSALVIESVEPVTVALASIKRHEALICRARGVNVATVREYSEAMKGGTLFPPVVLFRDAKGTHWLADGFHRTAAAELAGVAEIAADIREGGRREALLHAASANAAHGLRRTSADKRKAVALVLAAYPKWSDRKIGEACGCDNKTVARVRATEEIPQSEREGADGKARKLPGFDSARELARVESALGALVERWPADDADGRGLLSATLAAWAARIGRPEEPKAPKRQATKKRTNEASEVPTPCI